MSFKIWCTLWLTMVVQTVVGAASIQLELTPSQPVVGEPVQLVATIKGQAQKLSFHKVPQTPGLDINWNSPSQNRSTTMVNGVVSQSLTLTWSATATSKGQYQLGPLALKLDDKIVQSKPIAFKVGERQTSRFFLVTTSSEKDEAIIGDRIDFHVDLWFAEQALAAYERHLGRDYELAGKHYDPISLPSAIEKDFHVSLAKGREARNNKGWFGLEAGTREAHGFRYRVHRLTFTLEPKRDGRLTIPTLDIPIYELGFQRDFFGRPSPIRKNRPNIASSEPLILKVLPPPLEGQPADFNGQVCGNLAITCTPDDIVSGQTVQLHSPLALTIILNSDRPGSTLLEPDWNQLKEKWDAFDVNTSAVIRHDDGQTAKFTGIIVRPKSDTITEVPAFQVSWFNAETKSYQQSLSTPFPIKVESISDQDVLDQQAEEVLALVPQQRELNVSRELHGLETDSDMLSKKPSSALPMSIVLCLSLSCWLIYFWQSTQDLRAKHLQQKVTSEKYSAKRSKQMFQQTDAPSEILEQLNRYLQATFKTKDPSSLELEGELGMELRTTLKVLEAAGYSPDAGAAGNAKEKALQLIDLVERTVKS